MKRILGASYKRGVELAAAGCPLDYLDAMRDSAATFEPFWAEQLAGYAESCVYVLGPSLTGFVIGLRLGTHIRGGTEISKWNFVPPWPEHRVDWDYEPVDVIPRLALGGYRDLLDSWLPQVLNDHFLLKRGRPVAGLLCGFSNQSIPESGERHASGKVRLVDDKQNVVSLRMDLRIYRAAATRSRKNLQPRRTALLDKGGQSEADEFDV